MFRRVLKSLRGDRHGALAVEVAFAIPVLTGLVLSGFEVTRFILLNQKIERAAATMADLVSQAEAISETDLQSLFSAAVMVVEPFDLSGEGRVVISSISKPSGAGVRLNWQRGYGAGSGSSNFGIEGATAVLPDGFSVRDGESIIVSETFYDFETAFAATVVPTSTLYSFAIFRPRFGTLNNLN